MKSALKICCLFLLYEVSEIICVGDRWAWEPTRAEGEQPWGYTPQNGPSTWPLQYPECGGERQSPIALRRVTSSPAYGHRLKFRNYNAVPRSWTLTNNGHTVRLTADWYNEDKSPRIETQNTNEAPETFILSEIHFHFGSRDRRGSEHTINGNQYPVETHFVHYNSRFPSFDEAKKNASGLAVIGALAKVSYGWGNSGLALITQAMIPGVIFPGQNVTLRKIDLTPRVLLPDVLSEYFIYSGSLTTPPCSEVVNWFVMANLVATNDNQLFMFRRLVSHYTSRNDVVFMSDNYRPPQPDNGRDVFCTGRF